MSVQWSRGCPFQTAEFSGDIIEVFGRRPRTKSPAQFCAESRGHPGDRFSRHRVPVGRQFGGQQGRNLCACFRRSATGWTSTSHPFQFYCGGQHQPGGVRAADGGDGARPESMPCSWASRRRRRRPCARRTRRRIWPSIFTKRSTPLTRHGLRCLGGIHRRFDSDDAAAIERQREWIATSRVPLATVGILAALPGTQLERRLIQEGRLIERSAATPSTGPTSEPRWTKWELLQSYARLARKRLRAGAYFERSNRSLELKSRTSTHFSLPWRMPSRPCCRRCGTRA